MALRIDTDLIEGLRYKLRMFGVPIDDNAQVFCDNESVVTNCTYLESTLKTKHCSIAYHRIREYIASGMMLVFYEISESNLADLLTKSLNREKRRSLIKCIFD